MSVFLLGGKGVIVEHSAAKGLIRAKKDLICIIPSDLGMTFYLVIFTSHHTFSCGFSAFYFWKAVTLSPSVLAPRQLFSSFTAATA